jgi:hypothetical protein
MTNKKKVKDITNRLNEYVLSRENSIQEKIKSFNKKARKNFDNRTDKEERKIKKEHMSLINEHKEFSLVYEILEELNKELEVKTKEAEKITEEYMKVLQAKKSITVKEFELIYGFGRSWQNERCRRVKNKLPRFQDKESGKILYSVEEVEQWFENENLRS